MSDKTPAEQAIDLLLFAPLGIALYAREHLDELIAKGRTQVEVQRNTAKMIGQLSVTMGRAELEKRMRAMAQPPAPKPAPRPAPAPAPSEAPPAPTEVQPAAGEVQPGAPAGSVGEPTDGGLVVATPADVGAEARAVPEADELGIPGYDALAASQVVARLAGLDAAELDQVRTYELAHRGRKTILSKIDQLQGA